ncbi:AB hydrolase-1 domain-containing protein [Phanerochaete sordida]|uniref:AB hydrolase-1 domain-containing protein n=1 Tax=Phanerochaete sordida TaxID=48140 RepID=A0A9P3L7H5_9APHY|nr:AB hydrolase-1 domain-containing protein [Phanerochaete sordida]
MIEQTNEQLLLLPDGRTVAYATSGNASSTDVVIFFHGVFGVGIAPATLAPALRERGVHYVAPTLPGWGNTSSTPSGTPFHEQLYRDTTAIIEHLHPNADDLQLYLSGGSFGTVAAQILYGAPYEKFPLGRHIRGMLLLAPFSPFKVHKEYASCLNWNSWFGVGPPARFFPGGFIMRLAASGMKSKMDTPEHAEEFIRDFIFKNMTGPERELYVKWKTEKGIKDGEEVKHLADGVYRSVQRSWDGFTALPRVFQSDWGGYSPAELDDEHSKPVLLFLTKEDKETKKMGEWLAGKLKNVRVRYGEGGHIGSMFVMDDIFADFMSQFL